MGAGWLVFRSKMFRLFPFIIMVEFLSFIRISG